MKTKIFKLDAATEIGEVCISVYDATLTVCASDDKELKVVLPDCKNVNVGVGENRLIINQAKRLIPFGKQAITIYIPTHVVPDVKISGNRTTASFSGGIFGELTLIGVCGEISLVNSSFTAVELSSECLRTNLKETTVKKSLNMQVKVGQLVAENSFAYMADCRLKCGNMGLINLSGNDFAFETETGNITLTLSGTENEYNVTVRVKSGTSNKQTAICDGAQKAVKALCENGNVVIDFIGERVEITEAAVATEDTQIDGVQGDVAQEKTL